MASLSPEMFSKFKWLLEAGLVYKCYHEHNYTIWKYSWQIIKCPWTEVVERLNVYYSRLYSKFGMLFWSARYSRFYICSYHPVKLSLTRLKIFDYSSPSLTCYKFYTFNITWLQLFEAYTLAQQHTDKNTIQYQAEGEHGLHKEVGTNPLASTLVPLREVRLHWLAVASK